MLLALACAFVLSQAFRSLAAIMGPPLMRELGLSASELGNWSAAYHLAFGVMQVAMGISLDVWGVRRTILLAFPLTVAGAALSAGARSYEVLMAGQLLIGTGCSPAFLVCTVFTSRHFAPERFTAVSGTVMSIGYLGMLLTATPLAWLIERSSWRWGFAVLAGAALAAWLLIAWRVHEPAPAPGAAPVRASPLDALRGLLGLFKLPHTLGMVAYGMVAYASFITIRGLWLGPLLVERAGFSLLASGNVALGMTLASIGSPALFGRIAPSGRGRQRWLLTMALVAALLVATLGLVQVAWVDVALPVLYGLLSGFTVLQHGYVHESYAPAVRGRALSLLTMAMFLGVALMQSVSGLVAGWAPALGLEPFSAALLSMSALLLAGAAAFGWLPRAVTS
ncbi:MAG: MFS transporter [Burkholderiaceae bacterium]|nr:MFS transporter [Pseudomonadota bacterium]MBS0595948.1 MFS transporter [Pseudomonadota bacterium]MCP5217137.1 MFS transporter [Burkholderiaceae bacterium]